ncbi:MAG: molecular chaperone DnaJ [Opitutales bacterium]
MPAKSDIFRPKVEAQPDNILFRFSLGQALFDEEACEEAIPHLHKCAEARNDWMLPRILLGKALLNLERPEEARSVLEEALRLAIEQNHEDPAKEVRELLSDL